MSKTPPEDQPFLPEIRRGRFERLTIFEVADTELDTLERGSPDSIYLNVAIALLAIAVSLTATLVSAEFKPVGAFTVFVVITVVGYVAGFVLLLLWRRSRASVLHCARTIRNRLPAEGVVEPLGTQDLLPPQTGSTPEHRPTGRRRGKGGGASA